MYVRTGWEEEKPQIIHTGCRLFAEVKHGPYTGTGRGACMFRICMRARARRRETHKLFQLAVGCLPRSNMGRITRVEARVCAFRSTVRLKCPSPNFRNSTRSLYQCPVLRLVRVQATRNREELKHKLSS